MIRPDEIGSLNPEDLISGDNGHDQRLTIRRTMTVADPRKRCAMVERLADDQFGNVYLIYSARLTDGEIYEVADRVRDSVLKRYGGFTDGLLDDFRGKAFHVFAETEKALSIERSHVGKIVGDLMLGVNLGGS